ncbi:MAG TPA: VCBS domain-containing protein, partial [Nocardioides sp.]
MTVFGVTDGFNTPPDITGDTTGLVYEDGAARLASGILTADEPVTWSLQAGPALGSLSFDPLTAGWIYTLNTGLFQVQQLAQNQTVGDAFIVRATDADGAFTDQTVEVTVTGTNDRPNLPPTPLAFSAIEDGGPVSAQTSAFDVDNFNVLHWSLNRGSALGYSADYEFRADSFSIEKNGAPLFHDEFDAGGPPPSAPTFANGNATNYTTTGNFQEIGGKLVMRGSDALAFRGTGNDALVVGNEAILVTNVSPTDTVLGLKQNHQFVVEGVFDLVMPQVVRQTYGLTLTDGVNQIADDLLSLRVRLDPDDEQVYVDFVNSSSVLDTVTLVERDVLVAGGADQIRLILTHDAGSGDVSASYELLTGGTVTDSGSLGQAGIFGSDTPLFAGDNENWIRAGLFSASLDPREFAQGIGSPYGSLTVSNPVQNNVAELVYTPGAGAQGLGQNQSVVDSFFVRAVDQYGMSTPQRVDVTVTGINDGPVAVADGNSVTEDVVTIATGNVLTNDFDPDSGTLLRVLTPDPQTPVVIPGAYGTLTLNTNGSYEYLLNSAAVDFLQQGQVVHDIFDDDYAITDGIAVNFDTRLDIAITGTADAVVPSDGEVFEDGSRSADGHLTATGLDPASGITWTVEDPAVRATPDYRFLADNFRIVRNGTEFFNDDFGSGGPPPQAPNFTGTTTPASYGVQGTLIESGGRAILDGSLSVEIQSVGSTDLFHGNSALLLTDTSTNMALGLKSDDNFSVETRFDLVMPDRLEAYGVRLADIQNNDVVDLRVRHEADGIVKIVLRDVDVPANTITTLGTIDLSPLAGENQIVLRLTHDVADPGVIHASFDLLGGAAPRSFSFTPVGHIFGTG